MNTPLLLSLSLMTLPAQGISPDNHPQALPPMASPLELQLPAEAVPPKQTPPAQSQPVQSQPVQSQSIQSQPVQSQPIQSQPVQSQPVQSQPIPQSTPPTLEAVPLIPPIPIPGSMDPPALPDLTVTELFLVGDEARFKVQNRGLGEKKPGQVNYALSLQYPNGTNATYSGIAGITSLSRLRTLEETAEDRVSQHNLPNISDGVVLTLCINPDQQVPESSYDNNCLSQTAGDVLPDLTIVGGGLKLRHYRVPDQPWYEDVLDTIGDVLCPTSPGIDFDTSAPPANTATVKIRNRGGVPVMNFRVTVESSTSQLGDRVWQRQITEMLNPGETRDIDIHVYDLPQRGAVFDVLATIDSDDAIDEAQENNNTLNLPLVRDHRNQGGATGTITGGCD